MNECKRSLCDLVSSDYIHSVVRARIALTGEDEAELMKIAEEKIDFYPPAFEQRQNDLMERIGEQLIPSFVNQENGAPSASFFSAQHNAMAPLGGIGCFRIGEDGRLYFAGKSEHYHIPLGHDFPGYRLIENAKKLGIPNATHNNTRGYITRMTEKTLIAYANGIDVHDDEKMDALLQRNETNLLNRVINLETGSLAVEAALKMMLSRFYSIESKEVLYQDRTPVFLVMADNAGGVTANYHGTTVVSQTLRGLWGTLLEKIERAGIYKVVAVNINDIADFKQKLEKYNTPPYKTCGFCHEIIMMNYGGIRLDGRYLQEVYKLAHEADTPILCDEIQSCAWYDGLFLFRKYGLDPDFVSIGKGFPGGTYPASKILVKGEFDSLIQFGALVTNGQEELASLAYLITMEFIKVNGVHMADVGNYYHNEAKKMISRHPKIADGVEGDGHMTALCFKTAEEVTAFCGKMNNVCCIDISSQTYKPNCPPVALTKLPLIVSKKMVDNLIQTMEQCINAVEDIQQP